MDKECPRCHRRVSRKLTLSKIPDFSSEASDTSPERSPVKKTAVLPPEKDESSGFYLWEKQVLTPRKLEQPEPVANPFEPKKWEERKVEVEKANPFEKKKWDPSKLVKETTVAFESKPVGKNVGGSAQEGPNPFEDDYDDNLNPFVAAEPEYDAKLNPFE